VRWKLAAILLLTVACLAWFLRGMDPAAFRVSLVGVRWPLVGLSGLAYAAVFVVRCWRLEALMGRPLPFRDNFSINAIGFLAINTMPLRLGELVRPTLFQDKLGIPFGTSMAAIVTERLLDMLMLLTLLLVLGFGVDLPAGSLMVGEIDLLHAGQRVMGVLASGLALGLLGVLLLGSWATALARQLLAPLPVLRERVPAFLETFHANLLGLAHHPLRLLVAAAATAAMWGATLGGAALTLQAFPDLPHGWEPSFATLVSALTGMTVAPTPGFFGSFELFAAAALRPWGADPDAARAFAVVFHLAVFSVTVGVGLICALVEGVSIGRVLRRSRQLAGGETQ
jgi:glycosyltransferase 2 family protein